MSSFQKRKKPNFYSSQKARKKREFVLKPGLKGFLCTCNNREKDCIRESYNILIEYADSLYGEDKVRYYFTTVLLSDLFTKSLALRIRVVRLHI
jgi:hypothetical protein